MEMEEDIAFDERGKTCLQFSDFQLWMNFCEYCAENKIRFSADGDTMRAVISREAYEALPQSFRNLFLILDTETSRKILEGQRALIRKKRRAKNAAPSPVDEQKLIETLLPIALMPRAE